ncbi:MAG: hypothetical protein IT455_06635 [Planctomycetes bacterium]|nr:hypothetical protein [Planctomycetota bacterium]
MGRLFEKRDATANVVSMREVSRDLGIRWALARKILEGAGVEIFQYCRMGWMIRRSDWERIRATLLPAAKAGA